MYVLLFLAVTSGTPSQLGTYIDEQACQAAIREIIENKVTPRGVDLTPDMQAAIRQVVTVELKLQRDYKCMSSK